MIPSSLAPKPEGFAERVEQRGSVWLATHTEGRPCDYWSEFKSHLAAAFRNLCAEREIIAPLRHHTLIGLGGAKEAVWEKLRALNSRPFQELEGSRERLFLEFEKPALAPLPRQRYDEGIWKGAKVHLDYHIAVEGHHYSVPFQHIGKKVEARMTLVTVEIFLDQVRLASHRRSFVKGGYTTDEAHMPEKHRRIKGWTPDKILSWAEDVSPEVPATGRQMARGNRRAKRRRRRPRQTLGRRDPHRPQGRVHALEINPADRGRESN